MERLLVIDDDINVCRFLADYLEPEGFRVDFVHDGETGLQILGSFRYDLVILDVMLPLVSGLEILRRLRKDKTTPVIMVTSCGGETDRIMGLEIGADDYITKPFSPRELLARVRAILRRKERWSQESETPVVSDRLVVGDLEMQKGNRLVFCAGQQIGLTTVEFDILEVLIKNAGRIVLRNHLKRIVLGRRPDPYDRSIDVHIYRLRKKLGPHAFGPGRIRTIRSSGYLYSVSAEEGGVSEFPSPRPYTPEMIG
jgi:DNA-binding response OmpR family regulator